MARSRDIRRLFSDSAEQTAQIMRKQINAAQRKGCKVQASPIESTSPTFNLLGEQKVVLMGGYGKSRSLSSHLKKELCQNEKYQGIELKIPNLMCAQSS